MPAPGIITGGAALFANVKASDFAPASRRGVYASLDPSKKEKKRSHPGATPKYALNIGYRDPEHSDTIARLFIALPADYPIENFLRSLPESSRKLGEVLAVGGQNAGSGGTGFIDFVLTNSQENFQEKTQIVNTLTDNYVAFYAGQEAPVFQYAGTVLNTYQDDQRVWLLQLYQDVLRGTRLAQRNLIAHLKYDSFIVSGYLENLSLGLQAQTQTAGSFQFNLRVKEYTVHTTMLAEPTISTQLDNEERAKLRAKMQSARAATLVDKPRTATQQPAATANQDDDYAAKNGLDLVSENEVTDHTDLLQSSVAASTENTNSLLYSNFMNVTNDGLGSTTLTYNTNQPFTPVNEELPPQDRGLAMSTSS